MPDIESEEFIWRIGSRPCPTCQQVKVFGVTKEQYTLFLSEDPPLIQDIFPDMPPADRERFITGYCNAHFPKC